MNHIFGTDGIRTKAGAGLLTSDNARKVGTGFANWATAQSNKQRPAIMIARDTRISGPQISAAIKAGMLTRAIDVFDAAILPTPVLQTTMSAYDIDYALAVTASHNPFEDNGIKFFYQGSKLSKEQEHNLNTYISATLDDNNQEKNQSVTSFGSEYTLSDASILYHRFIKRQFPELSLTSLHIVIDCAYGAFSDIATNILRSFGARVTAINTHYDGMNINADSGALHPEHLIQTVLTHQADLGIACDGDGDRSLLVTKDGTVKDGDDIIALLAQHPRYTSENTIIGTITTNQGLEEHIADKGKQFIRTPVGDTWVKSALNEHGACLGGEPSGHIIARDIAPGSDALITTLLLIETAQKTDNICFHTFEKYTQKKLSIPISQRLDLEHGPAHDIIKKYQAKLSSGRMIVRYSGTEPVLRICIESKHDQEINNIWHSLYDDFLQLHTGL